MTEKKYYLQMTSPSELIPSRSGAVFEVRECKEPLPEYNRFLYSLVGEKWEWTDKNSWSTRQWHEYVTSDSLRTFVAYTLGTPLGYYELSRNDNSEVEIAYFGLVPQFIGKGYGGALLQDAIERSWQQGATRVWLHTCTRDHPNALKNYLARGFQIQRTENL